MALIGSTVDPRMFVQDYSGFQNAAAIQAAGMMNFGQQIGGALKDFGEENKKLKAEIAKGETALKYAKASYPDLAPQIDELNNQFKDPSKSTVEKAAIGSQMSDYVALMIGGDRYEKEMDLKKRAIAIKEAAARAPGPPPRIENIFTPGGGQQQSVWNPTTQRYEPVPASIDGDPTLLDLPSLDTNGNPIEQAADMWGADGGVLPPKGAIGDSIAQASRLGYKPPNKEDEWKDFERNGVLFSRNIKTNEVKQIERGALVNVSPGSALGPEDLKKGWIEKRDEKGNVTIDAIPDSPAWFDRERDKLALAEAQAKASGKSKDDYLKSAQDEQKSIAGGVQIRAVEDALNLLNEIPQGSGVVGGVKRAISAAIPGSSLKQLEAAIAPIKNTEFIKNLGIMRAASPTGGAVGNVSDTEGQRFEQLRASLDIQNQSPEQLRRNLLLFKEASLDYIHGTKAQRQKLVKDGKVTPEYNAQIEALYPQATVGESGKMQPRNPSGPTVDPSLLQKFPAFAP